MKTVPLISPANPARISAFRDARATEPYAHATFRSLEELARRWKLGTGAIPPEREEKRDVPLFSRGRCDGYRKKANVLTPLLTCLDVDGYEDPLEEVSERLALFGIDHAGMTTHSHGDESRKDHDPARPHHFRIFTDHLARSWEESEAITRRLLELALLPETRESWQTPCFFFPAVHPDRRHLYRSVAVLTGGSIPLGIEIPPPSPVPDGNAPDPDGDPGAVRGDRDPDEVLSALKFAAERGELDAEGDWTRHAMMMAHWNHPRAEEILDEVSAECAGYDAADNAGRFARFRRAAAGLPPERALTLDSLFKWARERGWHPPGSSAEEDFAEFLSEKRGSFSDNPQGDGDAPPGNSAPVPAPIQRTDLWNAERIASEHGGHRLRFVAPFKKFLHYDGRKWDKDYEEIEAQELAKERARQISAEAATIPTKRERDAMLSWAKKSQEAARVRAALRLARSDPRVATDVGDLDRDPMLLNAANGTLDLRTHELRPHDPGDLVTKLAPTPYVPGARCPRWRDFLEEVLPDPEVRAFFRRFMGYALQGRQREKVFALVFGPSDGGKTTAFGACARALGTATGDADVGSDARSYAASTDISTFGVHRDSGGNQPELAKLRGARLVTIGEVKGRHSLETRLIKNWTGGDPINATAKHEHPLSYLPDGTLAIYGNELPTIEFEDDAMWNRIVVVPFPASIPEARQVKGLVEEFDPAGVLAWMVHGHVEYGLLGGLCPPRACTLQKEDHRRGMDPLADFWEERVEVVGFEDFHDPDESRVDKRDLFEEYRAWERGAGASGDPRTEKWFTRQVKKRAAADGRFAWRDTGGGGFRGWVGLQIRGRGGVQ